MSEKVRVVLGDIPAVTVRGVVGSEVSPGNTSGTS